MADDMSFNPTRDDFEALLNDSMGGRDFAEGSVVKGKVVGVEKDFAIIDVGLKTEGRVQLKEFGVDENGKATGWLPWSTLVRQLSSSTTRLGPRHCLAALVP